MNYFKLNVLAILRLISEHVHFLILAATFLSATLRAFRSCADLSPRAGRSVVRTCPVTGGRMLPYRSYN